jgi:hypothetical protein
MKPDEVTGHIACMEEKRNAYRILVAKPEVKRPLGRCRHRWEDFKEIGWEDVDWVYLTQ